MTTPPPHARTHAPPHYQHHTHTFHAPPPPQERFLPELAPAPGVAVEQLLLRLKLHVSAGGIGEAICTKAGGWRRQPRSPASVRRRRCRRPGQPRSRPA